MHEYRRLSSTRSSHACENLAASSRCSSGRAKPARALRSDRRSPRSTFRATSLGKHRLLESRLASRPMAPSPQPHQRGVAIGITRHRRGAAGQPMVGRREGTVGRRYLERHRPARGFDRIVVDPPSTRPGRGTYRSIRNDPEHPLGIRRMQGCVRLLPR